MRNLLFLILIISGLSGCATTKSSALPKLADWVYDPSICADIPNENLQQFSSSEFSLLFNEHGKVKKEDCKQARVWLQYQYVDIKPKPNDEAALKLAKSECVARGYNTAKLSGDEKENCVQRTENYPAECMSMPASYDKDGKMISPGSSSCYTPPPRYYQDCIVNQLFECSTGRDHVKSPPEFTHLPAQGNKKSKRHKNKHKHKKSS